MIISDLNYMESAVEHEVVGSGFAIVAGSFVVQSNVANQLAASSTNSLNVIALGTGNSSASNVAIQSNNIG